MQKLKKYSAVMAPPAIILVGFLVAFEANAIIGEWAFIPLALVYWASIIFVVKPDKETFRISWKTAGKYCMAYSAVYSGFVYLGGICMGTAGY